MEFLSELGTTLIPIVALILTGLVPTLIAIGVHYLRKWTGVQVSAKQQEQLQTIAYDAVAYAEEQAKKYLKDSNEKAPSGQKMRWAMEYVARQALAFGLPELTVDALRDLIEAQLGAARSWKSV